MLRGRVLILGLAVVLHGCKSTTSTPAPPDATSNLSLQAPIERSDEAIPLGNGGLGVLMWGGDKVVHLSMDRGDLWDLRAPAAAQQSDRNYATLRRLHASRDLAAIEALFDEPYESSAYPTKIPAGRVELDLPNGVSASRYTLDLTRALGSAEVGDSAVEAFVSATEPCLIVRCSGLRPGVRAVRPAVFDDLGYAPARTGDDGRAVWFEQDLPSGLRYALVVGWRERRGDTEIAAAVATSADGADPLSTARADVDAALGRGFDDLFLSHRAWWIGFWGQSRIAIPDIALQAQYDFAKYLYGAGSRTGQPPMALQGIWTSDDGKLPPWNGDYLNDFNTEMAYLACEAAGLDEVGRAYLDWNWDQLPRYRTYARDFYAVDGAVVPGVMALDGQPLGGRSPYALSPTNGAWVAHAFYRHWTYTLSDDFLRERAYPFCAAIGEGLVNLLEPDESGALQLPLSSSPEIGANTIDAWLPSNSNYDRALLRSLFGALADMAGAMEDDAAAERWRGVLARIADLDRDGQQALTVAPGVPWSASHRRFSHALAVHPLRLLGVSDPDDKAVIDATVDGILATGTDAWVGYSFAWMACMLAYAGRGDDALAHLSSFRDAFVSRSGFHVNGDQSDDELSVFRYRRCTLEGNFLAMQAIHEMLLQTRDGVIDVFPAMPDAWPDAIIESLRAPGGFEISAVRSGGRTKSVRIVATRKGVLRLRSPFGSDRVAVWNRDVKWHGDEVRIAVDKGTVVSANALF